MFGTQAGLTKDSAPFITELMHSAILAKVNKETARRVGSALFVFACLLVAGYPKPLSAATTTIANVTATVNGVIHSPPWNAQALSPGQTLVLTANAPTSNLYAGYNFDISDSDCPGGTGGGISNCSPAVISFTADGVTYTMTDTTQALTLKNQDPGCCMGNVTFNEAQTYTPIGNITTASGLTVTVSVAYADSLHSDACGSGATAHGLPGSTICFPSPFNGSYGTIAADFFQGSPQEVPPGYGGGPYHDGCDLTSANCYDGGVIMFAVAPTTAKTFSIGPSSMEGALTIEPGDWVSGGFSFTYPGSHPAVTETILSATVSVPVSCTKGGSTAGTIVVPIGTCTFNGICTASSLSYNVPLNNSNWFPTGDQNSVLSWQGATQAPNFCGGNPMFNSSGAIFTATVSKNPHISNLANFRFKYRDPNAKGKGNVNCTDQSNPKRNDAATCGASWSQTVVDP